MQWVGANELALNIRKTNYMLFSRTRNIIFENFIPKINNIPIERKRVAKFLGVLVDEKLTWTYQISAIKAKMSRYVGTMYKLKNILPLKARLMIYNSLVQSHLNYCSLIWGTSSKSNIEKLFTTQKKAIRAIMPGYVNYFYTDGILPAHTKPFFKEANILTVHNIILKNIFVFLNTIYYFPETLPRSIVQLISPGAPSPALPTNECITWYNDYNTIPYKKTVYFKGSLLYMDIIHNNYIEAIHNTHNHHTNGQIMSRKAFKNWCKHYLHKIQSDGNEQEWESGNFKLYQIKGIRRYERIRAQDNLNV